jgi:UDP-glucuronate decarboxylase
MMHITHHHKVCLKNQMWETHKLKQQKPSAPKKILVTGGAGFIGSHLCARLLALGHHVISLDNYYTGRRVNLAKIINHPHFTEMEHDINTPLDIAVDQIYNLACPASPKHYQYDPVYTVTTNVVGMKNMLELAYRNGARILQASTSEVYGDPQVHPQVETYVGHVNPIGPRACYDEGKRCAETLCFDYQRQYNLDVKIARIFNTYGPNMSIDDGRVVSNFILQALRGEDITIYGTGDQTRSFCYVSDLVEGLIALMESAPGVVGPVNLGNPKEFTMKELAEEVIKETSAGSGLVFEDLPEDDPTQRRPDISRAKELLDWAPDVPLEKGLKKTVPYFKDIVESLSGQDLVFLSNAPSPYQLDFFNQISQSVGVTGIFTHAKLKSANAPWQMSYPAWVNILPPEGFVARWRRFWQALKGKNVRFVIIGGYKNHFSWLLLLWAKLRGVEVYFWFERPMPAGKFKAFLRSLLQRVILPRSSGIMAIDSQAEAYYKKYNKRTVRLPYSIDESRYKVAQRKGKTGPVRFLFIGQYIDRKGVDELLAAFEKVSKKDAVLTLAGAGPLASEVEAFCKRTHHVNKGFVQPDTLPDILAESDVFVFPSRYDGWGVVVAEAMAAGLPVISTRAVGAFADMNRSGRAGRFCEEVTAEEIYKEVKYYIDNRASVARAGQAARKIFLKSLANSRNAADYIVARIVSVG